MDDDWVKATNEVFETDIPLEEEEEEEPKDSGQDKSEEAEGDESPSEGDSGGEESPESEEDGKEEPPKEDEKESPESPPEKPAADEPEEKFASKEDIKAALREIYDEQQVKVQDTSKLKSEVLEKLYPDGIKRQLVDADGDPIDSIDQLMKLENPRTGELFTEEEAGRWMLENQQKLNADIARMEKQAEEIAETMQSVDDGAKRVMEVHGELLKSSPDIAKKLQEAYMATLTIDPDSGLIVKAPVDITDFYAAALSPYYQHKAAAEKAAAEKQAKKNQSERGDLSQRGDPSPKLTKEEKEWADARDAYYKSI